MSQLFHATSQFVPAILSPVSYDDIIIISIIVIITLIYIVPWNFGYHPTYNNAISATIVRSMGTGQVQLVL